MILRVPGIREYPIAGQVPGVVVSKAGTRDSILRVHGKGHRGRAALRRADARQIAVAAVAQIPLSGFAAFQAHKGIGKTARFENRILRYCLPAVRPRGGLALPRGERVAQTCFSRSAAFRNCYGKTADRTAGGPRLLAEPLR